MSYFRLLASVCAVIVLILLALLCALAHAPFRAVLCVAGALAITLNAGMRDYPPGAP